jgi:hypothetical protein
MILAATDHEPSRPRVLDRGSARQRGARRHDRQVSASHGSVRTNAAAPGLLSLVEGASLRPVEVRGPRQDVYLLRQMGCGPKHGRG